MGLSISSVSILRVRVGADIHTKEIIHMQSHVHLYRRMYIVSHVLTGTIANSRSIVF